MVDVNGVGLGNIEKKIWQFIFFKTSYNIIYLHDIG